MGGIERAEQHARAAAAEIAYSLRRKHREELRELARDIAKIIIARIRERDQEGHSTR